MLVINQPKVIFLGKKARLQAEYQMGEIKNTLWYEVNQKYHNYFTTDRLDAFVVGLLFLGIKNKQDIYAQFPMSSKLFYTINKYLLPYLLELNDCPPISLKCDKLISAPMKNKGAVGTGLSCGVDSFSTIYDHMGRDVPKEYEITHLTFFNVGSHGSHGGKKANELFYKRLTRVKECAKELEKELIVVNSNLTEILKLPHAESNTLKDLSAVLSLQKLFKAYYYSSAVSIKNFELNRYHLSRSDIFNLTMLSSESLHFYSTCSLKTRVEKTKMIADEKIVQKYLNVCIREDKNCGKCSKCLRTLFTLEIHGKLKYFENTFNLENYYNARSQFITQIIANYKKDTFLNEIFLEMRKTNLKVPLSTRLSGEIKETRDSLKNMIAKVVS